MGRTEAEGDHCQEGAHRCPPLLRPLQECQSQCGTLTINGLTGRESNVDIRHLDTNQVGNRVLVGWGGWGVGWGGVRWRGGGWRGIFNSTSFHPFLQPACVQMFNDDIYVTLLLRHFCIELQDAHRQRFRSESGPNPLSDSGFRRPNF